MSVMTKDKKRDLTRHEAKTIFPKMKELFVEDIEQDSDPQSRKLLVIRNYVVKLGEADWCNILQIREDQNWPEAELQAKLIYRRLVEIEKSSSPASKHERAFLKHYARLLLNAYGEGCGPVSGVPDELINILFLEYPGDDAVVKMALEEQKPEGKSAAITVVKAWPDISQKNLAAIAGVTQGTIREQWLEDLKAAGWKGPQAPQKGGESVETTEPKTREPWRPGDPIPQSFIDNIEVD